MSLRCMRVWNYAVKSAPVDQVTKSKEVRLRQIIAALYRELCRFIYDAWEYAAQDSPAARRTMSELLELRSHLELSLDWAPRGNWLRTIWERAGFLQNGVVFYSMRGKSEGARKGWQFVQPFPIAGPSVDQGIREIRALPACAVAYRVIVGKTTDRQELANRTNASGKPNFCWGRLQMMRASKVEIRAVRRAAAKPRRNRRPIDWLCRRLARWRADWRWRRRTLKPRCSASSLAAWYGSQAGWPCRAPCAGNPARKCIAR
jgi:hypothetical protein